MVLSEPYGRWMMLLILGLCVACQDATEGTVAEGTPFLPGSPLDASIPWDGSPYADSTVEHSVDSALSESEDATGPAIDAEAPLEAEDSMVPDASVEEDASVDPDSAIPEEEPEERWEAPPPPGPLFCNGSRDPVQTCRWMADCFASHHCPSASSEAGHQHVESFCHRRFNSEGFALLCNSGVACAQLVTLSPLCHRLAP